MAAQWVDIPLTTTLGDDASPYASDTDLTNLQLIENPPGSRAPFRIGSTPALVNVTGLTPGSGVITGMCTGDVGQVWAHQGTTVYRASQLNLVTPTISWSASTGSYTPSGFMRMVYTGTHVVMVDPDAPSARCAPIDGSALVTPSKTNLRDVTYQDGITLYAENGTDGLYASNLDDPTTIDALNFTTIDSLPGIMAGVASKQREVFALKAQDTEYLYNAGDSGFPFRRGSPGLIERGLTYRGPLTLQKIDNSLVWLGDDRRVYRMRGYQPERISTPWVDRIIADATSLYFLGGAFYFRGTPYYALSAYSSTASVNLICNLKFLTWHKMASGIATRFPLTAWAPIYRTATGVAADAISEQILVAGYDVTGVASTLFYLSDSAYVDTGTSTTTRTMVLPQLAFGGRRTFMSELYLDMEKTSAAGTCTVQWSDDGGTTYSAGTSVSLTNPRVRWSRLGSFYQRILKFTFSSASRISVLGCRAKLEIGS